MFTIMYNTVFSVKKQCSLVCFGIDRGGDMRCNAFFVKSYFFLYNFTNSLFEENRRKYPKKYNVLTDEKRFYRCFKRVLKVE